MDFNCRNVRNWMKENVELARQEDSGDVSATILAELAVEAFDVYESHDPLSDMDHWIWDVAYLTVSNTP